MSLKDSKKFSSKGGLCMLIEERSLLELKEI